MVSCNAEALHPRRPSVEGAAAQQEQLAAINSLGHSLRSSGRAMAALAPLPEGSWEATLSAAAHPSMGAKPTRTASMARSEGSIGIQFRLYRGDSNSGAQLERVHLSSQVVDKAFDESNESQWQRVLAPTASALEKHLALAALLEQKLEGPPSASSSEESPETGDLLPQLQGAVIMLPTPSTIARSATNLAYYVSTTGDATTTNYRLQMHNKQGETISAWHDIPLRGSDGNLNFVCEIPKGTSAKMEVATGEEGNPIKQDIKKGKLRHYYEGIPYNYGMLPQTWEDPEQINNDCGGYKGDSDPLDVVEIGSKTLTTGGVYSVKALGSYAMIDEGELDWKIICIRIDDPLADKLNDISDVDRELPGMLEGIMTWFKYYKQKGEGKPPNDYAYDSKALDAAFAERVVAETHEFYQRLRDGTHQAAVAAN